MLNKNVIGAVLEDVWTLFGGDVQSGMVGQKVYHAQPLFGCRVRVATYWALVVRVNLKAERSLKKASKTKAPFSRE